MCVCKYARHYFQFDSFSKAHEQYHIIKLLINMNEYQAHFPSRSLSSSQHFAYWRNEIYNIYAKTFDNNVKRKIEQIVSRLVASPTIKLKKDSFLLLWTLRYLILNILRIWLTQRSSQFFWFEYFVENYFQIFNFHGSYVPISCNLSMHLTINLRLNFGRNFMMIKNMYNVHGAILESKLW